MVNISNWYIIKVERSGGELQGYYSGYSTQWHPVNLCGGPDRAKIFKTLSGAEKRIANIKQLVYGDGYEVVAVPFAKFVSKTRMEICGFTTEAN